MTLYDFRQRQSWNVTEFPKDLLQGNRFFALCQVDDIHSIQETFCFDESTVIDCTDIDESVRFTSFDDYDFISLIHMEISNHDVALHEINLYVSSDYMIMLLPNNPAGRLRQLADHILQAISALSDYDSSLNKALYLIFHTLLSDYSDFLERFEDKLEDVHEQIIRQIDKMHFENINRYRRLAYKIKKQLRATSYLGTQILVNENGFIDQDHIRYFRSIETRLKKLYDFSESLCEFSNQLLDSYDSRVTMKTNETVNKLTALTLFFSPLTVITGIYGMNFAFMPELKWRLGYPAAIGLMAMITGIVYWLLKRNKWL